MKKKRKKKKRRKSVKQMLRETAVITKNCNPLYERAFSLGVTVIFHK